jgi:hypothetical protein
MDIRIHADQPDPLLQPPLQCQDGHVPPGETGAIGCGVTQPP